MSRRASLALALFAAFWMLPHASVLLAAASSQTGPAQMFASAHLAPERNLWNRVFDFNKGETCVPEPHWSVLREWHTRLAVHRPGARRMGSTCCQRCPLFRTAFAATEQIKSRSIVVDGLPAPVNPVEASPQATTGSAVAPSRGASSGGMVAFDIRSTSQSDAERALAVAAKRRT